MRDLKGSILLSRGDLEGSEQLARECLDRSTKMGFKKYVGKAEKLFAQILTKRGAYELAEAKLRAVLAKLKDVGNLKQCWNTHAALAGLYESLRLQDKEREHWKVAANIVENTADGLEEDDLRNTFLNAAPIRLPPLAASVQSDRRRNFSGT